MKKMILTILDGVGIREELHGNAFKQAKKPNFDYLWDNYPHSLLEASGTQVGLPEDQMGNSEVGHLNIGAGRVVYQPLQLINEAIVTGDFFENTELLGVIEHVKKHHSKLHIMGLLSDGGVHSHLDHFLALLKLSKQNNVQELYFHVITDGRDTLPDSAYQFIEKLEDSTKEFELGKIATISGRYYAMDRDNNWERIAKYYETIVNGIGKEYQTSRELVEANYQSQIYDEFIDPAILDRNGLIGDNDGIIWVNFRPDRAWEILSSITNKEFNQEFTRTIRTNLKLVTMMRVADSVIETHAFELDRLENTFGEYISSLNLKQLRIAETEKYAHVTYFFDGGIEKDLKNCDRVLINSPKVATYDLKPEMSAYEVTDKLLEIINNYEVVVLNYANGDMVGHTGDMKAAIKAIEAVDENLGRLYQKCQEQEFTMMIIADHGNCEEMLDKNDNVLTAHTTNKVPCIITDKKYQLKDGKLGDVTPTMLKIMELEIPKEMTGNELV